MKDLPFSPKTSSRKKKFSLLKNLLLGLFLLTCAIAVWLGLFFYPAEGSLLPVGILLLGAVFAFFAVAFSQRLLCRVEWKASWPTRLFCYAVVVGVLLKRGQSGLRGEFFFLWWFLFLVLFLLWFLFPYASKKRP